MRIMLDNGVFSHSEFAEAATTQSLIRWGSKDEVTTIHGIRRKAPHKDAEYQRQIDALPTIGRLIREKIIQAYEYKEIWCEAVRYRPLFPFGNALKDCIINTCKPAIDRSKFRQTIDFNDYISKGGRKDRKKGIPVGGANQIASFKWLCTLTKEFVGVLISHAQPLRLTDFEIESLQGIGWFQFLCDRSGSPENYPDAFHLWTAERNELDALLTLENGLPDLVARVREEKKKTITIKTQVLRPLDLLEKLAVKERDALPLEAHRFYYLHELS